MSIRRGMMVGVLFVLGAMAVPVLRAQSGAGATVDAALLKRVIAAWASMDTSKAAPFYAKDANLVFYDIAPQKYNGWAAYEKGSADMFKTLKSLKMTLANDAQVHTKGDMAWTSATVDGEMVPKDGPPMKIGARWSTVWEKRAAGWVIVHEHFSVPMPDAAPPSKD